MKTLWNDIEQAEKFLLGNMDAGESLLFEARMLTNPALKRNTKFLRKIYSLVFHYHRKKLRKEIEEVHKKLFNDPQKANFQQEIFQIFNP